MRGMPPALTDVYLFGDSVIDNSVWLTDPSQSVAHRLAQRIAPHNAAVTDLSVDALKLEDMAQRPNRMTRDYFAMHRYICDLPAYTIVDRYEDIPRHHLAVVSIGGNDVLAALKGWRLSDCLHGATPFLTDGDRAVARVERICRQKVLCMRMGHALRKVTQRLLERASHVALVVPYMPFYSPWLYTRVLGWDAHTPHWKKFVGTIRELYYETQAAFGAGRVSVIDLLSKVDFTDVRNYASTPIEPSVRGSGVLCDEVERVLLRLHPATPHDDSSLTLTDLRVPRGGVPDDDHRQQRRRAIRRQQEWLRRSRVCTRSATTPVGGLVDFARGERLLTNLYIAAVHLATFCCRVACRRRTIGTKIIPTSSHILSDV